MELKPFASLSSGLLARKGAARPAMRPQGFGQAGGNLEDLGWNDMGFEPPKPTVVARDAEHDDFADDVVEHPRAHPTGLTPVGSPVHTQQSEIEERLNTDAGEEEPEECVAARAAEFELQPQPQPQPLPTVIPVAVDVGQRTARRSPRPRAAPGSKAKAAFTLRLDPQRHLKLRLACAVGGRSAQQIVTDALDQLLAAMPELDTLATKAKARG